jgi:UDP-N-acetylglucosamine acyltransferase
MPTEIHPSSHVDPSAQLGTNVQIGPGCVVRGAVTLGDDVRFMGSVHVQGPATIGAGTVVYPFACLGYEPQDYKFAPGSPTAGIRIGAKCIIREHVTIHQASKTAHPTTVGDDCMLMVNSHLGHDAVVGNKVILVNGALLAGHSTLGDNVTISGNAAVHQFVNIGRFCMVSGVTAITNDMPPFCIAADRNVVTGVNVVGLRRNGVAREDISLVRKAFREIFTRPLTRPEMLATLEPLAQQSALVREMHHFIAHVSKRTIIKGAMQLDDDAE